MISRTVSLVLLNVAVTLTGIYFTEAAAVRQGDLLTGGSAPVLTSGGANTNKNGSTELIQKPLVTVRTLTSNVRTKFANKLSNRFGFSSFDLGEYVIDFVKFRQIGNDGPFEVIDYNVTVLGGEAFKERVWDTKSNNTVRIWQPNSNRLLNTLRIKILGYELGCRFWFTFTGSWPSRTQVPALSKWTSFTTIGIGERTYCTNGIPVYISRLVTRGADLQIG